MKKASIAAVEKYGAGSGGSRLMCGTLPIHGELEERMAEWMGTEASIVFGSGFLANLGVISALARKGDSVFFDRLDHASLIDGVLMSGASWKRFGHNDTDGLEKMLKGATGNKFIVADSVFSMDGDISPVKKLRELSDAYGAFLIVDEAHAIGVFGGGEGICALENVKADLITGTFSKAFGGYGGFAACSGLVKKVIINSARPFIFSTSLPPACLGSAMGALEVIREEKDAGKKLLSNSEYFHGLLRAAGLKLPEFSSQIIPVIIGDNNHAVKAASLLWEEGIYAKAIRPPTVPQGTARLRLSVTLAHDRADLESAAGKNSRRGGKGRFDLKKEIVLISGWGAGRGAFKNIEEGLGKVFSFSYLPWEKCVAGGDYAAEFIKKTGQKTVIIGWSLGSLIALKTAIEMPGMISGLALISPTPRMTRDYNYEGANPRELRAMSARLEKYKTAVLESFASKAFGNYSGIEAYMEEAAGFSPDELTAGLGFLEREDLRQGLAAIKTPALIMYGSSDAIIPPCQPGFLGTRIKGSVLREFNAGHGLPYSMDAVAIGEIGGFEWI